MSRRSEERGGGTGGASLAVWTVCLRRSETRRRPLANSAGVEEAPSGAAGSGVPPPPRRPRRVRPPRRLQPTTKAKSFFTTVVNQLYNLIVALFPFAFAAGRGGSTPPPFATRTRRRFAHESVGFRSARVCAPPQAGTMSQQLCQTMTGRVQARGSQHVASFLRLCCHDLLPWIQSDGPTF